MELGLTSTTCRILNRHVPFIPHIMPLAHGVFGIRTGQKSTGRCSCSPLAYNFIRNLGLVALGGCCIALLVFLHQQPKVNVSVEVYMNDKRERTIEQVLDTSQLVFPNETTRTQYDSRCHLLVQTCNRSGRDTQYPS